jgi:D-tyrosyl-tRNA(Tyr) deacylase
LRAILQRVSRASVRVGGEMVGRIDSGLLILVGAAADDDADTARRVARKCAEMRIFGDEEGRFNRSLLDVHGEALVVSQFTLLADVRKGRRPSFLEAASPDIAAPLVEAFAAEVESLGVRVARGQFGARMEVELVNDGPVTISLDSRDLDQPRRG